MGDGTPVPPTYMYVKGVGITPHLVVPRTQRADFTDTPPGALPEPKKKSFLKDRNTCQENIRQKAWGVHQRGYAITDSSGPVPMLGTMSLAPCIALIVHSPENGTAALTHVDANMRTASVVNVINEFAAGDPLDLYFHGGLSDNPYSQATCEGLLQALYTSEGGRQRFTVRQFDVLDRPHSTDVVFDAADATVYPGYETPIDGFDSVFRTLSDGTYLIGHAVAMANVCEDMAESGDAAAVAVGVAARDIRKQFDGRPSRFLGFLATVEEAVSAAVAAMAVQRAGGRGTVQTVQDAVIKVLRAARSVEYAKGMKAYLRSEAALKLAEKNLKDYLKTGGPVKAGDKGYLVEALIIALIHGDDLTDATEKWLAAARK